LLENIQRAFGYFIEKFIVTYNHYPEIDSALKAFTAFNVAKEIEEVYTIGKFLDMDDINNIR
jgi:hypothetical protein